MLTRLPSLLLQYLARSFFTQENTLPEIRRLYLLKHCARMNVPKAARPPKCSTSTCSHLTHRQLQTLQSTYMCHCLRPQPSHSNCSICTSPLLRGASSVMAALPADAQGHLPQIQQEEKLLEEHLRELGSLRQEKMVLRVVDSVNELGVGEFPTEHLLTSFSASAASSDLKGVLVSKCGERGLDTTGTVAALKQRLSDFDDEKCAALSGAGCLVSVIKDDSPVIWVLRPPAAGCLACNAPRKMRELVTAAINAREAAIPAEMDVEVDDAAGAVKDDAGAGGGDVDDVGGAGPAGKAAGGMGDQDDSDEEVNGEEAVDDDAAAPLGAVHAPNVGGHVRAERAPQLSEPAELKMLRQLADDAYRHQVATLLHANVARAQSAAFQRMCNALVWGSIVVEFDFKQKMKMGNWARADKKATYVTNKASMLGVVIMYRDRANQLRRVCVGFHSTDCTQDATCIIAALRTWISPVRASMRASTPS